MRKVKFFTALVAAAAFASSAYAVPTTFIDLGNIGLPGSYVFDTIGSTSTTSFSGNLDTELGLWNEAGTLLDSNDDASGLFSEISATLGAGVYFLGISEFNSIFGDNFVNTGSAFEDDDSGTAVLNIDGVFAGSIDLGGNGTGLDQTGFFRFELADAPTVAEPATVLLLGMGLLGFAARRRS